MSEGLRTRRRKKRSQKSVWKKLLPSLKVVSWLSGAAAVVSVTVMAWQRNGAPSNADISLAEVKRDLTNSSRSIEVMESGEYAEPEEPNQLAGGVAQDARPMLLPDSAEGPLFGNPLSSDVSSDDQNPIEAAQFQAPKTGRAYANQAVWLTGAIETD